MKRQSKNLRQRWVLGMIVEIDLMDGTYTYAQVISDTSIQFFDILRKEGENIPSMEKIMNAPLLFEIAVYAKALKDWNRISKAPLDPNYKRSDKYTIDFHTGAITIWKSEGGTVLGTRKDIEGMECFAVWEPGAVEQRLRDHFAARPCWYLEQEKPGWKPIGAKEFYAKYGYDFHWLDKEEDKKKT